MGEEKQRGRGDRGSWGTGFLILDPGWASDPSDEAGVGWGGETGGAWRLMPPIPAPPPPPTKVTPIRRQRKGKSVPSQAAEAPQSDCI